MKKPPKVQPTRPWIIASMQEHPIGMHGTYHWAERYGQVVHYDVVRAATLQEWVNCYRRMYHRKPHAEQLGEAAACPYFYEIAADHRSV